MKTKVRGPIELGIKFKVISDPKSRTLSLEAKDVTLNDVLLQCFKCFMVIGFSSFRISIKLLTKNSDINQREIV